MGKKSKKILYENDLGVKKRRTFFLSCRYCAKRADIDADLRDDKMGDYCRAVNKRVFRNSESCDHFELTKFFWCENFLSMIDVEVCIHRQTTCTYSESYMKECPKCREGRGLNHFINGSKVIYNIIGEVGDEIEK